MTEFIRVDDWEMEPEDELIQGNGKLVIIPFEKIFNRDVSVVDTFIIKKTSYASSMEDKFNKKTGKVERGIRHYLNYFIKFYDPEKELIMSYLKLKYLIDMKSVNIKSPQSFIKALHLILLTKSMQNKIRKMVDDNFYMVLKTEDEEDEKNDKKKFKYPEQLEITNEHLSVMMMISMTMKIMIPVLFHYINTYNLLKEVPIYIFYEDLFYMYSDTIDVYNKLWVTVQAKVKKHNACNPITWMQREILGKTMNTIADDFLKKRIITETMFRYRFNENAISYNSVILDNQLIYFRQEKYEHTLVETTNVKDSEGLSGLDKLEMNSYKIDESMVILSHVNITETIKKIKKSFKIKISKDEINFYMKFYRLNRFQVQLVNYFYAKYFGGYGDLNMLTKRQYIELLVILKKRLQFQGSVYLPQILTANTDRLNRRTIRNAKFLQKIENSSFYQTIVKKFDAVNELGKDNLILNMLSTIINTEFRLVDYDLKDRLGEVIEIHNTDILSDEFLTFINQL